MENKRFYRSTTSNYIGGVCGGLADYFNMDPAIIRIIFVLLALYGGGGVLIYVILWIVIPRKPFDPYAMPNMGYTPPDPSGGETPPMGSPVVEPYPFKKDYGRGSLLAGLLLVALGTIFLLDRLIPAFYFRDYWPVLLIILGGVILAGSFTKKNKENEL